MDEKSLQILEYSKILEHLADYCSFPASREKAYALRPTSDLFEARQRQAQTSEGVQLLASHPDLSIGGARDVRASVDLAQHGGVLPPNELLEIKYTLIAGRNLARNFERFGVQYPKLSDIAAQLPPSIGLIDTISRSISDRGEVLDSASEKLGGLRRELRIVHDRLMSKLQKMVTDPKNAPYLQENLITQRDGRYVLPLRAEFKGRIRSIVHDQSASGATLFIEPLSTVEMNNQYRELELAERDEVHRILTELSHQVGQYAYEINHTVDIIAELDLIFSSAKYAEDLYATEPVLHKIDQPTTGREPTSHKSPGTVIRLFQARHPLLEPASVVPIDVELDSQTYAMVITGPNTGGKTVTLKTVGLLALMAQSGLHIPTQSGSEISLFEEIHADIGDEQSIEQSLSTFSGHITNIIHILQHANSQSLVILDELGAGTDPQEGSALARAILTHLLERGITTLVTTHHPELKAFAHSTPGITNACVEFNLETLQPTFRLTIGLPGRSNALAIAERLGLPESIIQTARSEINPDDLRAEDLLDEILRQRDMARQARADADELRKESELLRSSLLERLDGLEDERVNLLEEARHEAESRLETLEEELASMRKVLAKARQPVEPLKEVVERVEQLKEEIQTPEDRLSTEEFNIPGKSRRIRRPLQLGDRVRLRNLGAQGVISAFMDEEAEVQVGVMRVRARLEDLELPSPSGIVDQDTSIIILRTTDKLPKLIEGEVSKVKFKTPESPGMELDLRGKRGEEALEELERYLDAAFLTGLPFVRIIHGKGTGKLRQVVRQALSQHSHVTSYQAGDEKEGGEGVTVAKLKVN